MKIKLVVITLLLLSMSVFTISAQQLGVRAGVDLNSSNIRFNNIDANLRTGFHVGVISDFDLPLIGWKINTGLLYSYDGFTLKQSYGNNTGITYHFNNNNLEIPINLRKEFNLLAVKPFVQGGVYASYLISGRVKDGTSSNKMEFKSSNDRIDVGLNFGVGASVISKLRLVANYNLGFNRKQILLGQDVVSYKNAFWSLSAEYIF